VGPAVIYLDSNVIIRFIEGDAVARAPIENRLRGFQTSLLASQLSRLECRCIPLRINDVRLLQQYDGFFASHDINVVELTAQVIDRATLLRARFNFRTPDAIHLASAIINGATAFLTGDRQLSRCTEIAVEIM
jgi:predicted nucleic acid-binding protein